MTTNAQAGLPPEYDNETEEHVPQCPPESGCGVCGWDDGIPPDRDDTKGDEMDSAKRSVVFDPLELAAVIREIVMVRKGEVVTMELAEERARNITHFLVMESYLVGDSCNSTKSISPIAGGTGVQVESIALPTGVRNGKS